MTKNIVKRDGRTEAFDAAKIKAAIEAAMVAVHKGLTGDLAQKAVQLSEQIAQSTEDGASIESIQDSVEKGLMDAELIEEAKAYIKYRAERTDIREARTHLMKIIDSFFTEKQDDGSSHKENANINASSVSGAFYRIGSEASKDYYNRQMIPKEFVEAYDKGYIRYHDSDYYGLSINCMQHDLPKMFKKGFSTGNAYITEPQSIESAMMLTCVVLQSGQVDLFGGQSIPAWDFYMEPYVEKSFQKAFKKHLRRLDFASLNQQDAWLKEFRYQEHTPVFENDELYKAYKWAKEDVEREAYQGAQSMVFNLNSLASRSGGQVVFSSLNFGTCIKPGGRLAVKALLAAIDAGIGKGITSLFPIAIFKLKDGVNYKAGDPNYDLRLLSEKTTAKRMFPNYSNIDAPYNLKYYKAGHPETEVAYMGMAAGKHKLFVVDYTKDEQKGWFDLSQQATTFEDLWYKVINLGGVVRKFDDTTEYVDLEADNINMVAMYGKEPSEMIFDLLKMTRIRKIMRCSKPAEGHKWKDVYVYGTPDGSYTSKEKPVRKVFTLTSDHPLALVDKGRTAVCDIQYGVAGDSVQTFEGCTQILDIKDSAYTGSGYDIETESDQFMLEDILSHNCRTRVIANVNGPEIVTERGNLSFTTINLPRLAIEANKEALDKDAVRDLFFQKLGKYLDLARRQLQHRYKIQCKRKVYNFPYVMKQGAYMGSEYLQDGDPVEKALENGTLSFGFVGLAECLRALTGHDQTEGEEYHKLGMSIVQYMRDYADRLTKETHMNWTLIATPAESVAGAMLRKDRAEFGVIQGVTDKEWYTNSFHVPVERKITASEKVRLEAPYHAMTNAGWQCGPLQGERKSKRCAA